MSFAVTMKSTKLNLCRKLFNVLTRQNCLNSHRFVYRINNCFGKFQLYRSNVVSFHINHHLLAKSFQETENEYAHNIMEEIPAYTKSIVKQSFKVDIQAYGNCPKEIEEFAKESSREKNHELKADSCLVFVYGTLKTNEPNYDQMTNLHHGKATYISLGKTKQKWPLVIASRFNIPFLLYKEGEGKNVIGEVYSVDEKMLSHMDEFESHPTYYTRIQVEVELLENTNASKFPIQNVVKPWVYFLKKYRSELLKLPYLEDYHSKDNPGLEYVNSNAHDDPENSYGDVMLH